MQLVALSPAMNAVIHAGIERHDPRRTVTVLSRMILGRAVSRGLSYRNDNDSHIGHASAELAADDIVLDVIQLSAQLF